MAANPALDVRVMTTLAGLDHLDDHQVRQSRLIAFLFPDIVSSKLLNALGFGAYNIHPGPPHYPGWAPIAFAVYQQAQSFGATLHHMEARPDTGAIVDAENFAILLVFLTPNWLLSPLPPACAFSGATRRAWRARLPCRSTLSIIGPERRRAAAMSRRCARRRPACRATRSAGVIWHSAMATGFPDLSAPAPPEPCRHACQPLVVSFRFNSSGA